MRSLDFSLLLSEVAWGFYFFAFTGGKERLQADVYADRRITGDRKFRNFLMGDIGNIPVSAGFLFNRRGFHFTFQWAMQGHRHEADLGQRQLVCFDAHALRDSESVGCLELFLSLWEPGSFLKEVGVGSL